MWLKLTLNDGSPLRLNSNLVEAYQPDGDGTILSTNDGGYSVREQLHHIDAILNPMFVGKVEIEKSSWK